MNGTWSPFAGWLLHTAVGGGLLLLLAWKVMNGCRQPAWRQRLGEYAVLAAVLVGVLNFGPSWITLPLPGREPASQSTSALDGTPSPPLPGLLRQPGEGVAVPGLEGEPDPNDPFVLADAPAVLSLSAPEAVAPAINPVQGSASQETDPSESRAKGLAPGIASGLEFLNRPHWLTWIAVAYAVAGVFLLGRWLLGHLVLWRLLRTAQPAPERVNHLFQTMARGHRRRPRLLVSSRLRVPLSCGLIRPSVLVPASLCEASATRTLRWVFAHELTHLERGDAWACVLFGLGQALYFYLPWFWWLRRQVRLCQEYIADAAAAEQAADPEDYAQFLVSLTRAQAVPLGALGVLGNTTDLFRRVTMLLQSPIRVDKRCPRWWSLAAASGLFALTLFVSGIGLRADAAPTPALDETVAVVGDDQTETPKPAEKKEEPAEKKKSQKKPEAPKAVLRDLEELLKDLPSGIDADQLKQLQDQFRRAQVEVEQAIERLKKEADSHKVSEALWQRLPELHAPKVSEVLGHAWRPGHEGRLGVQVQKPGPALADQLDLPKGQGLVIEQVLPDSAAAKAGLKAHDILLEFNGKPVPNEVVDFIKLLEDVKANTPVDAVVLRKGKKETIKGLSLPEAKAKQPFQFKVVPGLQPVPVQPGGPVPFTIQRPNIQIQGLGGPGNRAVMTTMFRTKDSFNTRYQEGSLIITVTGSITDGKNKVKQIQVQDGGKREEYESVDKVPEQYRDKVKNLIEMSEKNHIKVEVKTPKDEN